jgi:hypothetical protein
MAKHFDMMQGEKVAATYYARKRIPKFRVLIFVVLLLLYIIPGLIYLLWFWGASREHGFVAITNRRLLWLEFGKGWGSRRQHQVSLDLHMIAAVQLYTQHGIKKLFGAILLSETKAFMLKIMGRYPIAMTIGGLAKVNAFSGGGNSGYEPADNSLQMVQDLGSLILEFQRRSREGVV